METDNLLLDSDGDLFRIILDDDGDRDFKRIGFIESCSCDVPDEFYGEFEELEASWNKARREDSGCFLAFEAAYARARGI
jgi:hypothetical protein